MSEDAAQTQPEAPPAPLVISGQYVKDLSFEAPHTPEIFTELNQAPDVRIDVDVEARPLQQNAFEVILKFNITGKFGDKTAFLLELDYAGVCVMNAPQEQVQPLLLVEAPRLMFPFARSIISDVTRDSGFPALLMQPVDFVALYQQRMAQLRAAQEGGESAEGGEE